MDNSSIFNQYFYEILDDMEDLARNMHIEAETLEDKLIVVFCKRLKDAIKVMDKNEVFETSLLQFVDPLNSEEENLLFYDIVVPFYENWLDMREDENNTQEERVSAYTTCLAAENIVRILDNFLGYSYFLEDDEDEE